MQRVKNVLTDSNCHTLDRNNFRAHNDPSCGPGGDMVNEAAHAMYEVKYYPYVQNAVTSLCLEMGVIDSPLNI